MTTAPTNTKRRMTKQERRKRGLIVGAVGAVLIAIISIATAASGPSANITEHAVSVTALDGSNVRIVIDWVNKGKAAGSESCAMNTNVINQFGDNVNTEVNATNTNGSIKPGQSQELYQDIGVNSGDAQYIVAADVSFVDCRRLSRAKSPQRQWY